MVSTGYHDVGEEWSQKLTYRTDLITRDTTVEVLLYDDDTDSLADSADIGDITTELSGGNYTRQTFDLDSSDASLSVVNGDVRVETTVDFDLDSTTGQFTAYGLVVDLQSDVVNTESSQNSHLITTADLDGSPYNASDFSTFGVTIRGDLN